MIVLSRHSIAVLSAVTFGLSSLEAMADTLGKCKPYYVAVRSDFNDLSPLICLLPDDHAQGALLSETYNTLTGQNSASFDGLAAFTYQLFGGGPNLGLTAGLFVQADVTYQFQPTPSQAWTSDTITSGAFTQFAISNSVLRHGAFDFFRLRGGEIDASSGSRSATFVGEWIPVYAAGLGRQADLGLITALFKPEVMVQYDQFLGGINKPALFFARDNAMRVGPELVLQSWFTQPEGKEGWIYSVSSLVTFHEAWDAYTGRNYRWAAVSLTYSLSSHLGISTSYGYGNSETTGTLTSQAKLGLSVKF